MAVWRLQVLDWAGPGRWRWRWRLLDDAGTYVTDHEVPDLDTTAWQFDAFTNLHNYLTWAAAPDRRWAHQAELVEQVGEWVGANVLGPRIGAELARRRGPVHLVVPAGADVLGHLPWELARVGGRALAGYRTTLVVVPEQHDTRPKRPVGDRLRMLAVFSLPTGVGALNLRKERVALSRLVQHIAQVNNRAIELRVLQYGATRDRLEDAVLDAEGWDVVHLSGHGLAGGLVLETADGRHDLITSDDLVDLLDRGSDQIKLVTLSACESAAVTAAEHLRRLGLEPAVRDEPEADADGSADDSPAPPERPLPAVAAALVAGLDCAVLAMRYPVVDDFAIALTGSFYDLLLGKGQPVARALALSLTQRAVVPERATAAAPALSVGTPVLFGPRAADLGLAAPAGRRAAIDVDADKLAAFPEQAPRFVGRVDVLSRASQALAPGSGCPGVVMQGMAGAGKTACAVELAYTHQESFPLVAWFAAPEESDGGVDVRPVLASFALSLERQLGLRWSHLVDDPRQLQDYLPRLTEILQQSRVLLVIDNVESLLTTTGQWRDERWGLVVAALFGHAGLSRTVLTSRRLPVGLPGPVLVEQVHALSLEESVLLARELPNLAALLDGPDPGSGTTRADDRGTARRILGAVRGHPKLLELADAAAADPVELEARLDEADREWRERGTRLTGFLRGGGPVASDADLGAVLARWAVSAAADLPEEAALALRVVCVLEEVDRASNVLAVVWPQMWARLGRGDPAPDPVAALGAAAARGLVAAEREPDGAGVGGWRVHPGVAEAVRSGTDPELVAGVEDVAADAWMGTLSLAEERETEAGRGAWVIRSARSAAPYLLRRRRWHQLDRAAEVVLVRDPGAGPAAVLVPMLQAALDALRDNDDVRLTMNLRRTHARAVLRLDRVRGVGLLEELLRAAEYGERYDTASTVATDLTHEYLELGRYPDALRSADRRVELSRRAGVGPWSEIAARAVRLEVEFAAGRHRQVLDEVYALQTAMRTLPSQTGPQEARVLTWSVRESVLTIGVLTASLLGAYEEALDLSAENLASMRGRGAGALDLARARFNDYGALLRLGRWGTARALLIECRVAFEEADDRYALGKIASALADVENRAGHRDRAVDLEREALRLKYALADIEGAGIGHHNLALYLQDDGAATDGVGAHLLAACVIAHRTDNDGRLREWLPPLVELVRTGAGPVPRTFGEVCAVVDRVPGVDLTALMGRLPERAVDPETSVAAILAAAERMGGAAAGR